MNIFTINGLPIPKGRPRLVGQDVHTPARTKKYEQEVMRAMISKGFDKISKKTPVGVVITIFAPQNKSDTEEKDWPLATNTSDIDNYAKSILDGMNRFAFDDDSQVSVLMCVKKYSKNPRAVVAYKPLIKKTDINELMSYYQSRLLLKD